MPEEVRVSAITTTIGIPPVQQEPPHKEHSAFTSNKGIIEVSEKRYIIRVLKMLGSTLVFIGHADNECLNEMALAMPMPSTKKILGTTVIGDHITSSSQQMAEKLSNRFKRQIFVSHNVVTLDALEVEIFERAVSDYVRKHLEEFI